MLLRNGVGWLRSSCSKVVDPYTPRSSHCPVLVSSPKSCHKEALPRTGVWGAGGETVK